MFGINFCRQLSMLVEAATTMLSIALPGGDK